jgi:asparagine synthase (glutamine-hydrolysing)
VCGIAGIVRRERSDPVDAVELRAMTRALAHRGPDGEGLLVRRGVGLGHRRLAVIDPTARGAQPMKGEGDVWIVYNGEMYEHAVHRRELEARGRAFWSDCDTEVILALYESRGLSFLDDVKGQFAIAIWDEPRRRLVLARDRFGKKPLYWHLGPRGLAFASELRALVACSDVPREPDPRAILDYLTYHYVPDPESIYRSVSKLAPGQVLVWEAGAAPPTIRPYFRLDQGVDPDPPPLDEAALKLRATLERAVRRRLVADVPLGAFLSGGIDSSTVVALMAGLVREPVRTSSIGFDEESFCETKFAGEVARRFATDHDVEHVRPRATSIAPLIARHFGEPFADASAIPTYYLSRLARRRVTVALSGDGGDEAFAGYRKYAVSQVEAAVRRAIPYVARRALGAIGRAWPADARVPRPLRAPRVLRFLDDDDARAVFRANDCLGDELRATLPSGGLRDATSGWDPFIITRTPYEAAARAGLGPIGRWLAVDLATYLPGDILVKVDRMSMAHALEVRSPFLDEDVVAFAARCPESHRLSGGVGKRILREAVRELLPPSILGRRKMGFGVPLDGWFRGELRELGEDLLLGPVGRKRGLLEPRAVEALWAEHQSRRRDRGSVIWSLVMLELWFREVHEAARPSMEKASLIGTSP